MPKKYPLLAEPEICFIYMGIIHHGMNVFDRAKQCLTDTIAHIYFSLFTLKLYVSLISHFWTQKDPKTVTETKFLRPIFGYF